MRGRPLNYYCVYSAKFKVVGVYRGQTMDGNSLLALSELLKPSEEEGESDNELGSGVSPYATPAAIGPQLSSTQQPLVPGNSTSSKEISAGQKVDEKSPDDCDDPRPQPEYDMVFRQSVNAEDVFFGMGNRNPTTASCEELVVKIKLPGVDIKEVDLDITETFLDCRTKKYRLGLHLPHKVADKETKAKWISDKEILEVILKLNRELDFANF